MPLLFTIPLIFPYNFPYFPCPQPISVVSLRGDTIFSKYKPFFCNKMKTKITLFLTFLLLAATLGAQPRWSAETLPMVHLQDARRYVCNPDGVLSAGAVAKADSLLMKLEQATGVETVVVAVKRLEGNDAFSFAMDLARKYKIGKKDKNNGLIIVLTTEDREYGIFPGSGLEGTLPDARCYSIRSQYMLPALKKGMWDEAILKATAAINGVIRNDPEWTAAVDKKQEDDSGRAIGLVIALSLIALIAIASFVADRRRCPKCKKQTMRRIHRTHYRAGRKRFVKTTWRCKVCGHEETIDREDHSDTGGLIAGATLFGMGRGGGGFSGGSFGGGSFGGGGSSGRF